METETVKPTIGRMVHFRDAVHQVTLPAIITEVHSDVCVNLVVFDWLAPAKGYGHVYLEGTPQAAGGNFWNWPVRE